MFRVFRRGESTAWFNKSGVLPHQLNIYFRWYKDILVVIGVSQYSVDEQTTGFVQIGLVVLAIYAPLVLFISGASYWAEKRRSK